MAKLSAGAHTLSATLGVIGAFDTKADEFAFVLHSLQRRGYAVLTIHFGVMGEPAFEPDIGAAAIAEAGGGDLATLREQADRGAAMAVMARGAADVVRRLYEHGRIDGLLGMGGSAGTAVATAAMRELPVGFPKVMVSTVAAGDVAPYVGVKDIVMIPSVVDVAGVNRISAPIYANAVGAICGMVEADEPVIEERPLVAASMFGNTTPIVDYCRGRLDEAGYETIVFHATGAGGKSMDSLVADGHFVGVLDITTTEWADNLTGGVFDAGSERGDAAGRLGLPQLVVPGCLDMANFGAPETMPAKYQDRNLYQWNPQVTLMRTTPEENAQLGRILAEKANAATGPVVFLLPLRGVSMLDSEGEPFWWPEADAALFDTIRQHVKPGIEVVELDHNINDPEFCQAVAERFLTMLGK